MDNLTFATHAWSGNARPWRAKAYRNGVLVAIGGFCKTEAGAIEAARRAAAKREREAS